MKEKHGRVVKVGDRVRIIACSGLGRHNGRMGRIKSFKRKRAVVELNRDKSECEPFLVEKIVRGRPKGRKNKVLTASTGEKGTITIVIDIHCLKKV